MFRVHEDQFWSNLVSSQSNITTKQAPNKSKQNKFGDNLRLTQEASLSTSLGPSPILIIVKPLFPVLFPGIHENDRNLTCCTSSDTGAAVNQDLLQASVCHRVPEELLPHKAVRVSSCPRKTRNCFTAILPLGNIYSMCYSIPTSSLPMQSEMWKCQTFCAKDKNPLIISGGWTLLFLALSYSNHE